MACCIVLFCLNAAADMEVISAELAQQMVQEGKFLVHQTVMGHTYGISAAAVRKLQASGKLPVLDLDRVADVARLKESGFQVCLLCWLFAMFGISECYKRVKPL
jgi:hypothetical protein